MKRCVRCFCELSELAVFCAQCAMPHEPDFDLLLQRRLNDRYQIYRRLGEGGLSTVYAATDTRTDQIVVVKISDPRQLVRRATQENSASPEATIQLRRYWSEMLERMRRETAALAALRHPHIVQIFDTDVISDDLRYIVMEMLHGKTLRDELAMRKRFSVEEAVRIATEIIDGLKVLHARGIIHRDINPRNLFLCGNPREAGSEPAQSVPAPASQVKIIDFGISRFPQPQGTPQFTQYAVLSGTVSYASPEQCQGLALDHRTDIYSLGVTLYEMITGQRPFIGRTPTEIALKQIQSAPVNPQMIVPSLSEGFASTILRALSKEPDLRFQSAADFAVALREGIQRAAPRMIVPLQFNNAPQPLPDAAPVVAAPIPVSSFFKTAEQVAQEQTVADEEPAPVIVPRRRRIPTVVGTLALAGIASAAIYLARNPESLSALRSKAPVTNQAAALTTETLSALPPGVPPGQQASSSTAETSPTAMPSVFAPWTAPSIFGGLMSSRSSLSGNAVGQQMAAVTKSGTLMATPVPVVKMPSPGASAPMPQVFDPEFSTAREPQITQSPTDVYGPVRSGSEAAATDAPTVAQSSAGNTGPASSDDDELPVRGTAPPRENSARSENSEPGGEMSADEAVDRSPRVISWSGQVNDEREVRLELPGAPGNINIPRAYRKRVGIVEPPSPKNQWRCVVLRVFGRGQTSIVVQWWPEARQATGSAGRFLNRHLVERFNQASQFTTRQLSRFRK